MNYLAVGADAPQLVLSKLDFTKPLLLIDDGPAIDALTEPLIEAANRPNKPRVTLFDPHEHSFNPLKGMDYRKARDFLSLLDATFPEGQNTLTKKNSNFVLLQALMDNPKSLDTLITPDKDPATLDAYQKIQTLYFSPVLKQVLSSKKNTKLSGVVLVRLNRAEMGDFDCFVLAHLLIGQSKGQVAITDFGFYGRDYLSYLIREERLIAGVRTLAQLSPALRQEVLLINEKDGSRTTAEDAGVLADYHGLVGGSSVRDKFIIETVG